jgi:hypothetical protein
MPKTIAEMPVWNLQLLRKSNRGIAGDIGHEQMASTGTGRLEKERIEFPNIPSTLRRPGPVRHRCPLRVRRDLRFHFTCGPTTALRGTGAVSKESGTANHAEHANGGGALQGQDDAFDLKARLAEVE